MHSPLSLTGLGSWYASCASIASAEADCPVSKWRRLRRFKSESEPSESTAPSDRRYSIPTSHTTLPPFPELPANYAPGHLPAESTKPREKSQDRRSDPLGLTILYEPESSPTIDIIFVHGLGGTSRLSWSKNRDLDLFWPQRWLPLEPNIRSARILTFGYNAHFMFPARENILNISDFATKLLFGMKFGEDGKKEKLSLGHVPIIFVAHSMGGLVVKKAFILGQFDPSYKEMLERVRAMVFLATPHRGADLAETLNTILAVSIFNHAPKQFIAELQKNSPTLQEINDQFRKISLPLKLVSFYETEETEIGFRKTLIVQRDSSTLGYPGEIQNGLDADHHGVIKYSDQDDPNYKTVRDVITSLVLDFCDKPDDAQMIGKEHQDMPKLQSLLGICAAPEDDLEYFSEGSMPGTGDWVLKSSEFEKWLNSTVQQPLILWMNGVPGTGKSHLSSSIIQHLQGHSILCQYFFFRFGDMKKRSLAFYLRSMAFQIASVIPSYRKTLLGLSEEGLRFENAEVRHLWQKLFVSALFKHPLPQPLYWVVDAIDEADAPQTLMELLSSINESASSIRILCTSRRAPAISTFFGRFAKGASVGVLAVDEHDEVLRAFVMRRLQDLRGTADFREYVINCILIKAGSNFLWAHLVTREIVLCHTEMDIKRVLEELPADLEPLYSRMELALVKNLRPDDMALAKLILTWATSSRRALYLHELTAALQPNYPSFIDLRVTIGQVCGDFVVVDNMDRLTMVHHTAREYITSGASQKLSVERSERHCRILERCLSYLMQPQLRLQADHPDSVPLLDYAATSWPYHLSMIKIHRDQNILIVLTKFFHSSLALTWIQALASSNNLQKLVQAAKALILFLEQMKKLDAESSPLTHLLREKDFLSNWSTDLVKVVGKFGIHLSKYPKCVYRLVAPFCPKDSIFYQLHAGKVRGSLSVQGFTDGGWDDSLARFSIERDCQALSITCINRYFAIVTSQGSVILYYTSTCEEARRFDLHERILAMRFDIAGKQLVTCGFRSTTVWDVSSGSQLQSFANPKGAKAIAVTFAADNSRVITCCDDRAIRCMSLLRPGSEWNIIDFISDKDIFDGDYVPSPRCAAFNFYGTQLAVTFRGYPLLVWEVDPPRFLSKMVRSRDQNKSRGDLYSDITRLDWSADTGQMLGLYNDGCVFTWYPADFQSQELELNKSARAAEIRSSPSGNIFVTAGADGTLRIWNYQDLSLIYQLSCKVNVSGLAISPDSRRLYDLRESFCNVWEPNALIRLSEADEKASETSSEIGSSAQLSWASEASAEIFEPITALTVGPTSCMFSSGNDEGVVYILDKHGKKLRELPPAFMAVDHIAWSKDERILATGDLGGRICVRNIDASSGGDIKIEVVLETKVEDTLHQLLIHPGSKMLLASTSGRIALWNLEDKTAKIFHIVTERTTRWLNHPSDADLLIVIHEHEIDICQWSDLSVVRTLRILQSSINEGVRPGYVRKRSLARPVGIGASHHIVDRTYVSCEGSFILVELCRPSPRSKGHYFKDFMLIPVLQIDKASALGHGFITTQMIPPDLLERLEQPLGFISGETLAFLDRDFWVCTRALAQHSTGATPAKIKRHYFLPQDWLNTECLQLALVTRDGTLLCPRNGEVAAVWNGLRDEWTD
jgi:WD40 repeat protein/pimeloyl-ACP methyl ester carboxylesterase